MDISLIMSISPTSAQIKIKELLFLQIQTISLDSYSKRNPTKPPFIAETPNPEDRLLQRLHPKNVLSFTSPCNRVMQAFSNLLLRTIYGDTLNENLLNLIKLHLYSDDLDLTIIKDSPFSQLKSEEIKKLLVEFIVQMYFSDFKAVLDKKLSKHPVILAVISVFLRCVLAKIGLQEANDYTQNLPVQTVVQLLNDFFDLNYRKTKGVYLYFQTNLFLYEIYSESILVGTVGQQNDPQITKKLLNPQSTLNKNQSILTQMHAFSDNNEQNNFLRQSLAENEGAPTPFFNNDTQGAPFNEPSFGATNASSPKRTDGLSRLQQTTGMNFTNQINQQQILSIKHYNITTPSVASIEDKLYFLASPTYSDGSYAARNRLQNRFQFAANLNDDYFIDKGSNHDNQNQTQSENYLCQCQKITKMNLRLHSNIYSLSIRGRHPKEYSSRAKAVPSFITNSKLRKLSDIEFQKNKTERGFPCLNQSFKTQRVTSEYSSQKTAHTKQNLNQPARQCFQITQALYRQSFAQRPLTQYTVSSPIGSPKYVLPKPRIKPNFRND